MHGLYGLFAKLIAYTFFVVFGVGIVATVMILVTAIWGAVTAEHARDKER